MRRNSMFKGLKIIFYLWAAAGTTICRGQNDGAVTTVTPVTPNAAALFKPAVHPLGNFSGTVPVEIPLHTLKVGNISVPVGLSYAMGGIKVEEVASNVGLGWSLLAGGSITRVMNGLPDDEHGPGTGYLYMTLKPSGFPGTPWLPNVDNIMRNYWDIEPDIYYYSFNGNSGKFFFDESGNVVMDNQNGFLITPVFVSYALLGWIITDLDGTKYYFGMPKDKTVQCIDYITTSYSSVLNIPNPPTSPGYNSNWHLAEIRDMNEENIIKFQYAETPTHYQTICGAYGKLMVMGGTSDCTPQDSYTDEVMLTTYVQEHYPIKISTRDQYMVLSSTTDRTDYPGASRLNSISIYDSAGIFKKKFNFNYTFFVGGSGADELVKRLKLKGVSEFGSTGTDSLAHTFDYYEAVNLPSRISHGVDYWGYYNGQNSNWTFLPNFVYSFGIYPVRQTNNAERRASPTSSCANSLTKIHFPTGGYRQFQYEGNTGLLEQGTQLMPDESYKRYQSFTATSSDFSYLGFSFPAYTHDFVVSSSDGGTTFGYTLTGTAYGQFKITITNTAGIGYLVNTFINQYTGTWQLPNGNYRLDFYYDNFASTFSRLNGNWLESTVGATTTYRYGQNCLKNNANLGGIRIKQIDDYDHITGKILSTKYKYTLFSDSTLSSGLQIYPLTVAHYGNCSNRNCQTIQLYPKSCYPMASEGGSFVYYPEVTTYQDGNGYIQREFSFAFDGTGLLDITQYPVVPPKSNGWLRGKLMVERIYDQTKTIVRKTLTSYPYTTSSETGFFPNNPPQQNDALLKSQTGWKLRGYYSGGFVTAGCWTQYSIGGQFTAPGYVIDSIYSPSGKQGIRTENYYYTSLGKPFLKQQKIYINNNKTREINYKYAFNNDSLFVFGLSTAEHNMKSTLLANNYMQPLETTVTLTPSGGSPAFSEGNKFSSSYFNATKIHLGVAKHFNSMADSVIQNYTQYDGYGNLCEQYKSTDVRTVYLYGYHNTLPVAKIVGSDYASCMSYVSNGVLQVPSSDQALRDEVNKIRTGLAGTKALVTTYTYLPLIGMSSQVDPAGVVTFYEFDNHGRLVLVRDQNQNIVKKYSYNVVNPQ